MCLLQLSEKAVVILSPREPGATYVCIYTYVYVHMYVHMLVMITKSHSAKQKIIEAYVYMHNLKLQYFVFYLHTCSVQNFHNHM